MAIETAYVEFVSKLVKSDAGIVLPRDKSYLVESRLQPLAKMKGFDNLDGMLSQLFANSASGLRERVVEAMAPADTSFFRDPQPFDALHKIALPDVMKRRNADKRLDIWSAGCSTGQEPFSIALVFREFFAESTDWRMNILATDISNEVLKRANRGKYSQLEVNRGIKPSMLLKYFQRDGVEWQIKDEVRQLVEFRRMNLLQIDLPPQSMDIVFLRNVLVDFDAEVRKNILDNIRQVLRPGGYLFVGRSDCEINLGRTFVPLKDGRSGCYRYGESRGDRSKWNELDAVNPLFSFGRCPK